MARVLITNVSFKWKFSFPGKIGYARERSSSTLRVKSAGRVTGRHLLCKSNFCRNVGGTYYAGSAKPLNLVDSRFARFGFPRAEGLSVCLTICLSTCVYVTRMDPLDNNCLLRSSRTRVVRTVSSLSGTTL